MIYEKYLIKTANKKGVKMRCKKNKNRKAFTLVELLVVVMIISLLAGIVAPRLLKQVGGTKVKLAKPKMTPIETAIDAFFLNTGQYPGSLDELITCPSGLEDVWNGPYLKNSQLLDPWDNPYIYVPEGSINPGSYDLISYGADGAAGGDGENADIYND